MYISGEMSILMSVPPGSERREVTVEVLYSQIFAGINALKLQGQIKCKSKFSQWRTENCGLFLSIWWKQDSWIMDPLSALVKPEEFLPQTSRDFWSGLGKMAYLVLMYHTGWNFWQKKSSSKCPLFYAPVVAQCPSRWVSESVKALQQWCVHPRFIPLSFCTCWYQWGALQGSSTWQCHGHGNFGPQHCSPTWIALHTWVLLDLWPIKSQECQMSLWELIPQLDPSLQQYGKGRIFNSSNPHDETCSQSSCQEAISQHELTCMSQAQQIGWAHCLLQVLCERVKHYAWPMFVCFKDSRLFRLLLINMALVRCCSNTNKASWRGKRLCVRCQS